MEHRGLVTDNQELAGRLASLEYSFLNQRDGTADAFGFDDKASTLALSSGFPDFPGVGKSTITHASVGGGNSLKGRGRDPERDMRREGSDGGGGDRGLREGGKP